jgi:hypothetical protein
VAAIATSFRQLGVAWRHHPTRRPSSPSKHRASGPVPIFGRVRPIGLADDVSRGAAASGLLDAPADPGTVFLYRSEPRELAVKLGVDCSKMDGHRSSIPSDVRALAAAMVFPTLRARTSEERRVVLIADHQELATEQFALYRMPLPIGPRRASVRSAWASPSIRRRGTPVLSILAAAELSPNPRYEIGRYLRAFPSAREG